MKRPLAVAFLLGAATTAQAFCGFYVGKADARLFNEASQVIVARDGDRTVVSMLNDYQGDLKEFAVVVPVPTVLQKGQVHVGDKKLFDRLDAYSAPRLAEYYDPNPCDRRLYEMARRDLAMTAAPAAAPAQATAKALGVTVEASFSVGEYDIVILSATQSDGLETWLKQSGYRIPPNSARSLAPYIRQNMKFFVAKVNLAEQAKTGFQMLRPLQFAYESEKFMLPIRLGMANARGPQDLIAYMLTRNGRVETTNYRTVKLPANMDLPVFLKQGDEFRHFYKALFDEQAKKEDYRVAFTEYFWDMSWCDPCAADPLSQDELRQAGVFWLNSGEPATVPSAASPAPPPAILPRRPTPGGAQPVMLTRLHIRYTPESFPEDLMFQETRDRQNFQTRYVLRHPAKVAPEACPEARAYLDGVARRQEQEARQLASLTGGDIDAIRRKLALPPAAAQKPWWEGLWK